MAFMTIGELLRTKGSNEIWSINPQSTVYQALEKLAEKDIGALLVMEKGRLVGIFSERDYARKIILMGKSSLDTKVKDVMTTDVVTITPEYTIEECMALMTDCRVRHLPVVDQDTLLGLVSIGDVVKAVITGQARLITSLENYIFGADYGKV